MFHKIREVIPLDENRLSVHFAEGVSKIYYINPNTISNEPKKNPKESFNNYNARMMISLDGYQLNDKVFLSSEELFKNGKEIKTSFDGLIALSDATILWGLNESTLRKAISYGKLKNGVDVMKFGKQWIITKKAMIREYGEI